MNNITPFTYRDGVTYLEILYLLKDYITDTLRPEFMNELERIISEFNAGIGNAEDTITEYKTTIDAAIAAFQTSTNAAITAFEANVNAQIAANETAFDARMDTAETDIATAKTGWQTAFDAFMADVESSLAPLNDAAVAANINNGASATAIALAGKSTVNAKDFGAVGNGVADDTAALQSFITYLTTNGVRGYVPKGTYKITDRLNFSLRPGWEIHGAGKLSTTILQATDNKAIFYLGSDTASTMHNWGIDGIGFDYVNNQPAANTSANCIQFAQETNNGYLTNLLFRKGFYAIKVTAGIGCPWGCTWDNLNFGDQLTGGAMDFFSGVNGVPNNKYGRFFVTATNMVGPIFAFRGYNTFMETVEIIMAQLGAKLFQINSGGEFTIGAIKLENGVYNASQTLIDCQGSAKVKIGQLSLGGTTMTVDGAATKLTMIAIGGGLAGGSLIVDSIMLDPNLSNGAQCFAVNASNSADVTIGAVNLLAGAKLLDQGSTATGETTTVTSHVRGRLSTDQADADLTIVQGGPNKYRFITPFTAERTINLPGDNNSLFNGLYYEFLFDGSINASGHPTFRANGGFLRLQSTDKVIIGYTYRRHATNAASGWIMTKYETLP